MFRSIDTDMWSDPWFEELDVESRYVFIYLMTNPQTTSCGAFQATLRKMAFDLRMTEDRVAAIMASLDPKVVWFRGLHIVWVRNFYRRQFKNPSEKIIINARHVIADFPAAVREAIGMEYPELALPDDAPIDTEETVSIGYAEGIDTLGIQKDLRLKTNTQEEQGEEDDARTREVAADAPFALYSAFLDETAAPDFKPAPQWKKFQLAVAKRLTEQGYSAAEVAGCARYMKSQSWRTSPFDLSAVEKFIGTWEKDGKPEREMSRASPNGRSRRREPDFSGIDEFSEAASRLGIP